jgi:hypothetical protein
MNLSGLLSCAVISTRSPYTLLTCLLAFPARGRKQISRHFGPSSRWLIEFIFEHVIW